MSEVYLRKIQMIDGVSCSVCRQGNAAEVLTFESGNYHTDLRLCLDCKKATIKALTEKPSKRRLRDRPDERCTCKGFHTPPSCPVHGR